MIDQQTDAQAALNQSPAEETRETFIPISRFALIDTLSKDTPSNTETKELTSFFHFLGQWRHQGHQERLLKLKECYLPFSPDRDTIKVLNHSEDELKQKQIDLLDNIAAILERANYCQIDDDKLSQLLSTHSAHGLELKVDRQEYDAIMVYSRGEDHDILEKRNWKKYFKKEQIVVPTFKRLFLLLKLKPEEKRIRELAEEKKISEKKARRIVKRHRKQLPKVNSGEHIYLKLFKNIPQEDVEMMFPNTQVKFKLFDKIKLGMTAGGGTLAGVAGAASKVMAAVAAANPIALATSIFGVIGVIVRQVMNFFNTRNKYMLTLSQRLYFHSLADNRGALTLLCDRGEEEDVKEELLLYHFLLHKPAKRSELKQLDKEIETFLTERFGVNVNFDIEDALPRLEKDGIIKEDKQGLLNVLPPAEACRLLENKWRNKLADMNGWISSEEFSEV